jgi:hypothetical protein
VVRVLADQADRAAHQAVGRAWLKACIDCQSARCQSKPFNERGNAVQVATAGEAVDQEVALGIARNGLVEGAVLPAVFSGNEDNGRSGDRCLISAVSRAMMS